MINPVQSRLADVNDQILFPREISWLSFNARVLQEARNVDVPLVQRVRYLGIFSNNLDEFFRVRVAEVRRLISVSRGTERQAAKDLLQMIQREVVALQKEFDAIYASLMSELQKQKIFLINERQLDEGQAEFVQHFFRNTVLPELEPILLDESLAIPHLADESLYLAVMIKSHEGEKFAVLEVPSEQLGRFIEIPRQKGRRKGTVFITLDNVIRACLPQVFRGVFNISSVRAYCFKFSRDAELELDPSIDESLIEKMASSLKQRRKADAVRFVYDRTMPEALLNALRKSFGFGRYDSMIPGGRYHNSKDFLFFPNPGGKALEYRPHPPINIPEIDDPASIFDVIRERDVLLYFPYHPFDYIVDVLKTAALDPSVSSIKICLYRTANNSRIAEALINALHNGKRVTAVVELAARFDEHANIEIAHRLTEAGVEGIFGIPGLKVHCKLFSIERKEQGVTRYYSHVGTGNFNEKTARLYTDFSLLTSEKTVGEDVASVFEFLKYNYRIPEYKTLLVSPHSSRSGLMARINREIEHAKQGYRAMMTLKCNNLVDRQFTMKLYEASQAGVQIRLIVRGMCSLLPGVRGISDKIQAISIIDRYLEHPRVYVLHNRGVPEYLLGSADLMTRNIDYRVEVLCPIKDPDVQEVLQDILDQQWHDNVKARVLNEAQDNKMVGRAKTATALRSQETIHRYLQTGRKPRMPRSLMRQVSRRRRSISG
ncbi:MAG: polyphosphate kinase 1 [Halieaceae bacterium]|nr:polyphosphate kinase 1 [Halieaceae bacterium]